MASLPNLDPSQPPPFEVAPGSVASGSMSSPSRKSVSFDLSPRTSDSDSASRSGGAAHRPLGVSLPLDDPTLPPGPSKRPIFSRHRHDANPALALKVLQDIHLAVESWHGELRQTVQLIQDLYLEGPIVDGWLETVDSPGAAQAKDAAALLRHADLQTLSGYVDQICGATEPDGTPQDPSSAPETAPNYRLCSLNADGQLQCMPCPPEQVSTLSLAIARHQKLRQLVDQKRYLEAKLKRAVEVLTNSRDGLGIVPQVSSAPEGIPSGDGALS